MYLSVLPFPSGLLVTRATVSSLTREPQGSIVVKKVHIFQSEILIEVKILKYIYQLSIYYLYTYNIEKNEISIEIQSVRLTETFGIG